MIGLFKLICLRENDVTPFCYVISIRPSWVTQRMMDKWMRIEGCQRPKINITVLLHGSVRSDSHSDVDETRVVKIILIPYINTNPNTNLNTTCHRNNFVNLNLPQWPGDRRDRPLVRHCFFRL
jgi:hypothetical protein